MNKAILTKLRKIMALADSPNANEAAAALRKAQELMTAYNITESDVAMADVEENARPLGRYVPTGYQADLINLIGKIFSCEYYIDTVFAKGKVRRQIKFVSLGPSSEVAAYCYTVLYRKLTVARSDYYRRHRKSVKRSTRIRKADLYAQGWVHGCRGAAAALIPKVETTHPVVAAYLETKGLITQPSRTAASKRKSDNHALWNGMVDGKKVSINQPVYAGSSEEATKQLNHG
jgi:hypothetical protein